MNRLSDSLSRPPRPITPAAGVKLIVMAVNPRPGGKEHHHCLLTMNDGTTRTVNATGASSDDLIDFYIGQPFDETPARCIRLEILS